MRINPLFYAAVAFIFSTLCIPTLILAQTPHIDSLLTALKTLKEDTSKANTLHEIARAYQFELNDRKKVGEYGLQQLILSKKLGFSKGIGFGYFNRAIYYRSISDFEKALEADKNALPIMQARGDKKAASSCLLNMGLSYYNLGNYKEALTCMFSGVKTKELMNDKKGMASGYINIGNIYEVQGNYTEALKFQLKALKIKDEQNEKRGKAICYNNIGNILKAQDKLDEALGYYQKSLLINIELKDPEIGNVYDNIGNIYMLKEQFPDALDNHFKSLEARTVIDDKRGMAISYNDIGNVYLKKKELDKAILYHLKAHDLNSRTGYKKGLVESTGSIGFLYEKKGNIQQALYYYDQMLVLAEELNYKEQIRDAYKNFASIYKNQKRYELALKYTALYNEVKDSILNKENFKQVSELNTRYETDKKEKEILLLTKDQQLNAKIIRQQQLERWGLIGGLGLLMISVISIYRRYRFKQKANVILEKQKQEIQEKTTLITDSIDYAKTIQEAVLPTTDKLTTIFPDSFVLYKPKSIVSGDFYWLNTINNQFICAVADCTGHGVPGAFMSLLGYNMLENAVKTTATEQPSVILDALHEEVVSRLSTNDTEGGKHGMDISLISIDRKNDLLNFAGAHNSIYIVRNGQLIELKADKIEIGSIGPNRKAFTNHSLTLQKDDMIYLFTDGFPDQIGGPNRKKFYYPPFKELLIAISHMTPQEQHEKLNQTHINWLVNTYEQTDDLLIMGIRYS
jgi:serine phosphatase RsbU (regulator of sigma subunit)